MKSSLRTIFSLYRSYLRQIRKLPHKHLRQFFHLKGRDDIQTILSFKAPSLILRNIKTVSKAIKKVERANRGNLPAFHHVLDLAYGRKGKLKWELLEPILYPGGVLPVQVIQRAQKIRPPVISAALQTLLTSSHSRTTKPLDRKTIVAPRALPARVDPLSEDARIFGPLSKRREVNIRWRFFRTETKKLLPPLGIHHIDPTESEAGQETAFLPQGFPGLEVFRDVEGVVGEVFNGPSMPRRERQTKDGGNRAHGLSFDRHPSRWVRRRFRALLTSSPRLVSRQVKDVPSFTVDISPRSIMSYQKTPKCMPEADPTTLAWFYKSIVYDKGVERRITASKEVM